MFKTDKKMMKLHRSNAQINFDLKKLKNDTFSFSAIIIFHPKDFGVIP